MKRTIPLWLGLLAFALLPALAQKTSPMGKIHGHVTNATGAPQADGTVSLSTDGGYTALYSFPVSATGDYAGEAAPDTYTVIFREKNTPAGKTVDSFDNVKVIVGQDVVQDIDMSREAFINKMSPDQRKQLEEFKKQNAEVLKSNAVVKHLNADLHTVAQDFKDADAALQTAAQTLGATASKADIAAKEAAIKTDKYTDAETLMLKDTQAKPDASILWAQLGQAQLGLKQYDAAEASYKKVLELETASGKKPNLEAQGTAYAGLGEIYARTGKIPEATAAYDEAAKAYPPQAGLYLKNEAVIFYQEHNPDAQAVAADKAVKADPTLAIAYYLKGNGLVAKTTVDPKTQKLTAPPGCIEAYKKYLELDPNGAFAGEVRGILVGFGQKTK